MKINKIRESALKTITKEVISSAKKVGVELEQIHAEMWKEGGDVGTVKIKFRDRLMEINYFKREGTAHLCNLKKGDSKLADTIYERISVNTSLMPTYSTSKIL